MQLIVVCAMLVGAVIASPQYSGQGRYNQQYQNQQYQQYQPQQQQYQGQYQQSGQYYSGGSGNAVPIVSATNDINPDGSYSYSYQTGDGQSAQAQGYVRAVPEGEATVSQGSYSYTAPDGTPITVNWVADENGFRADGAHLPTPPPIPEAIQKSLAQIAQAQNLQPSQIPQYNQQYNQQQQYYSGQQQQGAYRQQYGTRNY